MAPVLCVRDAKEGGRRILRVLCDSCRKRGLRLPWLLDRGYAGSRIRTSENARTKLSEKGFEQRSDYEFGRYTEHEMGQKGTFRRPVGLRCERVRDFSDSFRRSLLGTSGVGSTSRKFDAEVPRARTSGGHASPRRGVCSGRNIKRWNSMALLSLQEVEEQMIRTVAKKVMWVGGRP